MSDTIPTRAIACLNCGSAVEQEDIKLFAGVGVCPDCHQVAQLIMRRGQAELETLKTMMKETIRVALIEGTLHLPRGAASPSKADVLGMIVTMKEAHERRGAYQNVG